MATIVTIYRQCVDGDMGNAFACLPVLGALMHISH